MDDRAIARGMRPNRHPLDDDSASRLLQGSVHPDDAPPGYGAVAGLLVSASQLQLATVDEDAAATTVSAMVEAIRASASTPQTHRRRSMIGKLFAGKALAAVGVVVLTASGAAAATGSLPDPVQGVVAGAVSHVGVDIPQPGDHGKSADHRQDANHGSQSADHSQAGGDNGQSNDDHGQPGDDQGQSGDHSKSDAVHTAQTTAKETGAKVGPAVCAVASDGKCHTGDDSHGQGAGKDEGTTTSTVGSGDDQGDDQGQVTDDPADHDSGDDHADHAATPTTPTTPTTGSAATGEEHSGRDVGSSGQGQSGNHH